MTDMFASFLRVLGIAAAALLALEPGAAHADTQFAADVDVTYFDAATFQDSDQAGGDGDTIRFWNPTAIDFEFAFETANIVDGVSIRSINDVTIVPLPSADAEWSSVTISVASQAFLDDVVSVTETELPDGGFFVFLISIEGALSHDIIPGFGGYDVRSALAGVTLTANSGHVMHEETLLATLSAPVNQSAHDLRAFELPPIATPAYEFGPGASVDLSVGLRSWLELDAENIDGGTFSYLGTADASHTATIEGVAVFDPDMNPVTGVTVQSANGLSYSVVPEPGAALLLPVGSLILGLAGRVRRSHSRG